MYLHITLLSKVAKVPSITSNGDVYAIFVHAHQPAWYYLYLLELNMWSLVVSVYVGDRERACACVCECSCNCMSANGVLAFALCACPAEVNKSRCPVKADHHSSACVQQVRFNQAVKTQSISIAALESSSSRIPSDL